MKALFLSDEINQFHASMLKSVLLIIALLPAAHGLHQLWQSTEGASQIIVGFVSISLFSALSILGFMCALWAQNLKLQQQPNTALERRVVQAYRYVPMLFLMSLMSYLATKI